MGLLSMYFVVLSKLSDMYSMGALKDEGAQAAVWHTPFFESDPTLFRDTIPYIFTFQLRNLLGAPLLSNIGNSLVLVHKLLDQKNDKSKF